VDGFGKGGEDALFQPESLANLLAPCLKLILRLAMEPVADKRVPLADGIRRLP